MAHQQQRDFFEKVRFLKPDLFNDCKVLDLGSLDINGNNRHLFNNYTYIGVDIGEGRNVDVVCRNHEYKSDEKFDVVISSECFEHDEFWDKSIENGISLLKEGGLFTFTCATTGRPEHGTKRTSPRDSPFTSSLDNDYYMNLTEEDVRTAIDLDKYFSEYEFEVNDGTHDLYFWGIKRSNE